MLLGLSLENKVWNAINTSAGEKQPCVLCGTMTLARSVHVPSTEEIKMPLPTGAVLVTAQGQRAIVHAICTLHPEDQEQLGLLIADKLLVTKLDA